MEYHSSKDDEIDENLEVSHVGLARGSFDSVRIGHAFGLELPRSVQTEQVRDDVLSQKDEEPYLGGVSFCDPGGRVYLILVVSEVVRPLVVQDVAKDQCDDLHLEDRLRVVDDGGVLHHVQ